MVYKYFDIFGFIVTKMDGDFKGGVVLFLIYLTKCSMKYICYGEFLDCINIFHLDRIVFRILDIGNLNIFRIYLNQIL